MLKYRESKMLEIDLDYLNSINADYKIVNTSTGVSIYYGKKGVKYTNSQTEISCSQKENTLMLQLINKVKKDCRLFYDNVFSRSDFGVISQEMQVDYGTYWSALRHMNYHKTGTIFKIDIKSAYWECAKSLGVISDETYSFFESNFKDFDAGKKKLARLKALGSLATIKNIRYISNGKVVRQERQVDMKTRNIYLYICSVVDSAMRVVAQETSSSVGYYFDCVFIGSAMDIDKAQSILIDEGFSSKIEGEFDYIQKSIGKGKSILVTYEKNSSDEKTYYIDKYMVSSI